MTERRNQAAGTGPRPARKDTADEVRPATHSSFVRLSDKSARFVRSGQSVPAPFHTASGIVLLGQGAVRNSHPGPAYPTPAVGPRQICPLRTGNESGSDPR